ncbi:FAR1 DNA binding domain-containing protein [Artemisia annua]|uniref:FAR1 DNA binding domain-containing protein n=1 Tax=Artemisia annua TaxID=35608 RepID=A0A2U1Q4U2_ARTAN|nr:FAR1 DNA binding domain-containing protein [Artemisia annua]
MVLIVQEDTQIVIHSDANVVQDHDNENVVLSEHEIGNSSHDHQEEINGASDVDVFEIDPEIIPTPHGHTYWMPDVPVDEKPVRDTIFDSYDEAYNMYKAYAFKARFGVRKSTNKYVKGILTHKYVLCNRAGKPRKTVEVNTLNEDDTHDGSQDETEDGKKRKRKRRSASTLTDCKARIGLRAIKGTNSFKLFDFVENHNHPLIDKNNMDLSRARRQLQFDDYVFIHRASLSNMGPTKAHRLRVALLGGFDKYNRRNYLQVLGDLGADSEFRKEFHKLVWNVYIGPEVFEERWHSLISKYNLKVQQEIRKGLYACSQVGSHSEGDVEYCVIRQRDKSSNIVINTKVTFNQLAGIVKCSCDHFNRHGYLCRHVFCVFVIHQINTIPVNYISRRWIKNVLPAHLHDKRHRYGPCIEETDRLASQVHDTIEDCIDLIRNDPEKLAELLSKVKELKKSIEANTPPQNDPQNKDALYENLLGVTAPAKVIIKNPKKTRPKGHNRLTCPKAKGKGIADEDDEDDEVDEELEVDEYEEVDGDGEDLVDEEDEDEELDYE